MQTTGNARSLRINRWLSTDPVGADSPFEATAEPRSTFAATPILPLFLGLLTSFHIDSIGELYVTEICLAIYLLGHWKRAREGILRKEFGPSFRVLLFGAGTWLLSQLVSDAVAGTPAHDWIRGSLAILFTITNLLALGLLLAKDGYRSYQAFIVGVALSSVLGFLVQPTIYARSLPWKFGFAFPVTLLVMSFVSPRLKKRPVSASLMLALVSTHLLMGYRSQALICGLVFVLLLLAGDLPTTSKPALRAGLIAATLGMVGIGLYFVYAHMAENGSLGEAARTKYYAQSAGEYGLIAGARPEVFFTLPALRDSSILGRGSYSKETQELRDSALLALDAAGYGSKLRPTRVGDEIPTHSMLLGSWVSAGIAGLIFWILSIGIAAKGLGRLTTSFSRLKPVTVFLAVTFFWDVLFSPYGGGRRILVPLTLLLLMKASRENLREVFD